jgi:hypothetical protein
MKLIDVCDLKHTKHEFRKMSKGRWGCMKCRLTLIENGIGETLAMKIEKQKAEITQLKRSLRLLGERI